MTMGYLPNYLGLPSFISTMFCSFHSTNFALLLNLFLSVLLFLILLWMDCFPNFISDFSLWVYRNTIFGVYWPCVLRPCLTHLLDIIVFLMIFYIKIMSALNSDNSSFTIGYLFFLPNCPCQNFSYNVE